ncbi:MAG TPA: HlyD family type I secretion periplasmic adaptor subunit, partial [Aestuariivirga sp.]|nr:HlyD family type I secretion periplasmic adaptor subunit [Aestuariivirga sp.]
VIAPATLMVESYSKKVQHRDGGIVGDILVKDGERVTDGQDLVRLDNTDTKAELAIVSGLLDEALVKKAKLEAQRDGRATMVLPPEIGAREKEAALADIISGQKKLLEAEAQTLAGKKDQLSQQVSQMNEQLSGYGAQISSKKEQLSLIKQELENLRKLQKQGLVQVSRVLAMEREQARLAGEMGALTAGKAGAESKISELKLQILQLDEEVRARTLSDLRDVEAKVIEYREKSVAMASRLVRTVIKAPITGTIYQMAVHTVGGVIQPGETIMLIAPEGDDLVLQAQVSPNDIDNVAEGQQAAVRFPALNRRLTPEIDAVVSQVGADTVRADAASPPYYAVRLTIPAKELEKLGEGKLKPGMSAEAYIQTGARSPMSYLLKPLTDQFAHALREN